MNWDSRIIGTDKLPPNVFPLSGFYCKCIKKTIKNKFNTFYVIFLYLKEKKVKCRIIRGPIFKAIEKGI